MPKMKRGPRSTPPPQTMVVQNPPYAVAKKPEEPKPAPAAKADPKPHYY